MVGLPVGSRALRGAPDMFLVAAETYRPAACGFKSDNNNNNNNDHNDGGITRGWLLKLSPK